MATSCDEDFGSRRVTKFSGAGRKFLSSVFVHEMYRQDDVNLRKHGLTDTGLGSNDVKKRVVPDEVRGLLQWDAELTNRFVAFMQNALPAISKSETKFMEVKFYSL